MKFKMSNQTSFLKLHIEQKITKINAIFFLEGNFFFEILLTICFFYLLFFFFFFYFFFIFFSKKLFHIVNHLFFLFFAVMDLFSCFFKISFVVSKEKIVQHKQF